MSKKICPQAMSTIDVENHNTEDVQNYNQFNNGDKNGKQCRICLQETYPLIIPCKCSGTVKYVHEQCLMHWAQQLVKKGLKEQQEDGDYQQVTSIDCQLCKQQIQLRIEWKDVILSLNEAKQRNQEYFWPIMIVNVLIGLICLACVGFSLAILIMVLTGNPTVDYQRFRSDPYVTWGTLSGALIVGFIFLYKAIKEVYSVFVKKQFKLDGVVYKQIVKNGCEEPLQNKVQVNQIKCFNDFNINIKRQTQSNSFIKQKNHTQFANIQQHQQQKSDVNLIIPKNDNLIVDVKESNRKINEPSIN